MRMAYKRNTGGETVCRRNRAVARNRAGNGARAPNRSRSGYRTRAVYLRRSRYIDVRRLDVDGGR